MSRKDYVKAASIIAMVADVEIREYLAREFADMFKADNAAFQVERFLFACGVDQ